MIKYDKNFIYSKKLKQKKSNSNWIDSFVLKLIFNKKKNENSDNKSKKKKRLLNFKTNISRIIAL